MKKPVIGLNLDFEEKGGGFSKYPWHALRSNYFDAMSDAGGIPIALPSTHLDVDSFLDLVDGLLMTGGNDYDPALYGEENTAPHFSKVMHQRSKFDIKLVRAALQRGVPVLGICGGMQAINIALGGSIIQHIPHALKEEVGHLRSNINEPAHSINIVPGTQLSKVLGASSISVNSFHHQAIKKLGRGLVINAVAEDQIIEGIEAEGDLFCWGLQWHPEFLVTLSDQKIFEAFIGAANDFGAL